MGNPVGVDTNELRQFSQDFWVSACVKTIMDEISSLEWDIVPKEEYEYDWVADQIRQVKTFLERPNKNNENFTQIIRALLKDILEIDAGVIVKVFDVNSYDFNEIEPKSGAPMLKPMGQRKMTELYVRDGASFLKEIDKFGFEKGYWQYSYQIPAHPMWFNRDEIVYIIEHPRSMSCYGYARTQAVLDVIKSLHYSTLYNKKFFEETTIPDGALSLLDTNEAEMSAFRNYWNNEFKAQPHKVAIMNKDIKWQPFAVTNKELEFLDTQKWYFNLIISMFGLTPAELGITTDLNRATSATQSELVKRKGIRPFLKLIEGYINTGILPEFGFEGIEFQFVYDDPAEKKQRLDNWQMELTMGVKTINEVRNELGLEPLPNGDVSNSFMDRMSQQPQQFGNQAENTQAGGYKDTLNREEGQSNPEKKEKQYKEIKYSPEQLKMGIEIEREHAVSLQLSEAEITQIALDHLAEDAEYYTKLKRMETKKAAGEKPTGYIKRGGKTIPIFDNKDKQDKSSEDKPQEQEQSQPQQEQEEPKIDEQAVMAIKDIATQVLNEVPESTPDDVSTGACLEISNAIQSHLSKIGIESEVKPIDSEHASKGHYSLYIPEKDIIIDTQLWQYEGNKKPIAERQIIFTRADYNKMGYQFGLEQNNNDIQDNILPNEIKSSLSNKPVGEGWDKDNKILNNKDYSSRIVTMDPKEYLKLQWELVKRDYKNQTQGKSFEEWLNFADKEKVNSMTEKIKNKDGKLPIPDIELSKEDGQFNIRSRQEGRHRALAALQLGQGFPVVVWGYKEDFKNKKSETKKKHEFCCGVDDGQYYHEQPISQPLRPSGAHFQPQNESQMYPSHLGDSFADTDKRQELKFDMITCPMCNRPTIADINSLETFEDDLRCTNCGARFNSKQIIDNMLQQEITNVLEYHNVSKSFSKELDLELDVKSYCGFDIDKSWNYSVDYAESKEYINKLKDYLSDIPEEKIIKIAKILKQSMTYHLRVSDVAKQIDDIIQDRQRAELIARTEIIRIANEGNLERMESKGVKNVLYISAPEDGRLCEECKKKDHQVYSLKESRNMIPIHPRCRCTFTEWDVI